MSISETTRSSPQCGHHGFTELNWLSNEAPSANSPLTWLDACDSPFAGRVGGNQVFVIDRRDPRNDKDFLKVPEAAPWMTLGETFDPGGFRRLDLWKFACLECIGAMMNVFISGGVTLYAPAAVEAPKTEVGIYHILTFFLPLFGGIANLVLTPLLIYTFTPSSGCHVSPTITLATFFARIISFPRAVLYTASQTQRGALAGFGIHTAYGSRAFTVGGCYVDTSLVPVDAALVIEFFSCLIQIFLAFGEALDPRQAKIFEHATGPGLVGVALGVVCWATAFTRPGYSRTSLNPVRCFGAYVASELPSYHWIHWVGPLAAAAAAHGFVYFIDPLWTNQRQDT
ncbi:aquaporin-like protein [Aspergillus alliaceus]|uniref:aquaporin-like protein n=1 Tax=Petromyces alliaceus TaxID=209559 RepID=UPI0012A5A0A6|nr:aquaporin-like protein [Aspergillus alliaceus]KAB8236685.1 aquaporin-like protein [Aspergillus alliaceus]